MVKHKELIKATCEMHNGRLKNKLDATGWIELLANGGDVHEIVEKIHSEGKKRLTAEIEEEEKQAHEILSTPEPEPIVHREPNKPIELCREAKEGPELCATLKMYGTKAQLNALRRTMESMGIRYEKVNL